MQAIQTTENIAHHSILPKPTDHSHEYRQDRLRHLAVAQGRLLVGSMLARQDNKLTLQDTAGMYRWRVSDRARVIGYASTIRAIEDIADAPQLVLGIIDAQTRDSSSYPEIRDLIAAQVPTLPLALGLRPGELVRSCDKEVDAIMDIRVGTCISSIARAAVCHMVQHAPIMAYQDMPQ
jgi:hypothetical protein